MTKWVYNFGAGASEGRADMKNLLGGKGANLAEMANLGLPVPPGFTITTEVCTYFYDHSRSYPPELQGEVAAAVSRIEQAMGAKFGDRHNPLLLSVRSGARASMPGMMDTVLNLGLNDETIQGLIEQSKDERFAYDSYRRFIQMYSDVVLEVDKDNFEHLLEAHKAKARRAPGYRDDRGRLEGTGRGLQGQGAGEARPPLPAGRSDPVVGRGRRRIRQLDEPARHHLSPPP